MKKKILKPETEHFIKYLNDCKFELDSNLIGDQFKMTVNDKPKKSEEIIEPKEPVEPVEPKEPVEPVEPVEPNE